MKRVIIIISSILLIGLGVLHSYNSKIATNQDELIIMLKDKLDITQESSIKVTYAGSFEKDNAILMWYIIDNNNFVSYKAVECKLLSNDRYIIEKIYTPSEYSEDILNVVWRTEDIYLINDTECKSIVYKDKNSKILSQIDILPEQFPYIFHHVAIGSKSTCSFIDSTGNEIR